MMRRDVVDRKGLLVGVGYIYTACSDTLYPGGTSLFALCLGGQKRGRVVLGGRLEQMSGPNDASGIWTEEAISVMELRNLVEWCMALSHRRKMCNMYTSCVGNELLFRIIIIPQVAFHCLLNHLDMHVVK